MKPVHLNVQKRIMFIPYINAVNFFIFIYNANCIRPPFKMVLKAVVIALLYTIPIDISEVILIAAFPDMEKIISFAAMYLFFLVMSWGLIRMQRSFTNES